MNFAEKERQWEKQTLNRYLDSFDREDEEAFDDVDFFGEDYDTHDEQWESLHGGDYFNKSIHFHRR